MKKLAHLPVSELLPLNHSQTYLCWKYWGNQSKMFFFHSVASPYFLRSICILFKHFMSAFFLNIEVETLHMLSNAMLTTFLQTSLLFQFQRWENLKHWEIDSSTCCYCLSVNCVSLFCTPRTVAHLTPLSMGFSRQEYWSGLPFPSPGDLSDPGSNLHLLRLLH